MEILKCLYSVGSMFVVVKVDGKEESIRIDRRNPIGSKQTEILRILEPKIQAEMDKWKGKDFFFGDAYSYALPLD